MSRVREKREYLQITASKSWITVIHYVIFSSEPDLYLNVPLLKNGTFKQPWNLIIQTKSENKEAFTIIFINVHLHPEKG